MSKYLSLGLIAAALALTSCGGDKADNSSVWTLGDPPSVGTADTARDIATRAARERFEADLAAKQIAAETWLSANSENDGVVTLPSGLQYKVLETGNSSGQSPTSGQSVKVQYEGTLTDGRLIDSSFKRGQPETIALSDMVTGWSEALQLMKPGDQWMLYLPPELGYGAKGKTASIPANAALIYRVVLIDTL